jgi:hypothetical protein
METLFGFDVEEDQFLWNRLLRLHAGLGVAPTGIYARNPSIPPVLYPVQGAPFTVTIESGGEGTPGHPPGRESTKGKLTQRVVRFEAGEPDATCSGYRRVIRCCRGSESRFSEKTEQGRTFERWYSPALGFNVEGNRDQPADDLKSEFPFQGIRLAEPDTKLFEIPAGYAVQR